MEISITEKLKELLGLFNYVDFKGVPINVSPCRPRIIKLIEEILFQYELPLAHGFEEIFMEMVRHPKLDESLCGETIANLERSQREYKAGQMHFKSILVRPKSPLKSGAVYLSYKLISGYTDFLNDLTNLLIGEFTLIQFLFSTKDIWCRDYMPIPIAKEKFVQFIYDPDYLKGQWSHLKTDPWKVTKSIDFIPLRSELIIDGGNVIRHGKTVIMTEKVFKENKNWERCDLLNQISKELEVEKVVIIPVEPEDYLGHSDGMVRFVAKDSVIINDYLRKDGYTKTFIGKFRSALESNGIKIIGTLPYRSFPMKNKYGDYTAIGCYLNYCEIKDLIIFPKFEIAEDSMAFTKILEYFPTKKVIQIDCREIAEDGGVLNCITWTI